MGPGRTRDRRDPNGMQEALGQLRARKDHSMGMGVCSGQPRCSSRMISLKTLAGFAKSAGGGECILGAFATPQVTSGDRKGPRAHPSELLKQIAPN